MRMLPALAMRQTLGTTAFGYWQTADRANHLLTIFRSYATAKYLDLIRHTNPNISRSVVDVSRVCRLACEAAEQPAQSTLSALLATSSAVTATFAAAHHRITADAPSAFDATADARAALIESAGFSPEAIDNDVALAKSLPPLNPVTILSVQKQPLWLGEMPTDVQDLWNAFQRDSLELNSGFEVWLDWYRDHLIGRPTNEDFDVNCATISRERLSQGPIAVNAYLRSARAGLAIQPLNRVRAIFIGHGEVGKTSLIRALHGEEVTEGDQRQALPCTTRPARYRISTNVRASSHAKRPLAGMIYTFTFGTLGAK
jgi:hypothetical protein